MECFAHAGSPAAGVCKACGKGACRSCLKDSGVAVACSDSCAAEAKLLHEMNQKAKNLYGLGPKGQMTNYGFLVYGIFGVLFLAVAAFGWFSRGELEPVSTVFGLTFVGVAAFSRQRARRLGLNC